MNRVLDVFIYSSRRSSEDGFGRKIGHFRGEMKKLQFRQPWLRRPLQLRWAIKGRRRGPTADGLIFDPTDVVTPRHHSFIYFYYYFINLFYKPYLLI